MGTLGPADIDAYFVTYGAQRWSRVSAGHIARMLRVFLRHAASIGSCRAGLAESIMSHRRYQLETLPYALDWKDVRRLIAAASGDTELDIRDRAILLLLAVYGLRRGEVAALRLEHIDQDAGQLRIWRLKRRQPQVYPLVPSVAQALAKYMTARGPRLATLRCSSERRLLARRSRIAASIGSSPGGFALCRSRPRTSALMRCGTRARRRCWPMG